MYDYHPQRVSLWKRTVYLEKIQEYCSSMNEHHQYERETHYVMLDSMKEHKERQRQQSRKERDEVYRRMSKNLDSVREGS